MKHIPRILLLSLLTSWIFALSGCNPPSGAEVQAPNAPSFSVAKFLGYFAVDLGSAMVAPLRVNNFNSSNQLVSYTIQTKVGSTVTFTDYDGTTNTQTGQQTYQVDGAGNLVSQTESKLTFIVDGSGNPIQVTNDLTMTYDSTGRPLTIETKSTNTLGAVVSHERKVFTYPDPAGLQQTIQLWTLIPALALVTDFTFTTDLTNKTIRQAPTSGPGSSIDVHYHIAQGKQLYVMMMPKFLGGILPAGYTVQQNASQSDNTYYSTITVKNASNQIYATETVEGVFVQYLTNGKLQDQNFQVLKKDFSLFDSLGNATYKISETTTLNSAYIKVSSYSKEEDLLLNQITEVREECSLDAAGINLVRCSTPDSVVDYAY